MKKLVLLLLLAGCSTVPEFQKGDKPASLADKQSCQYEAEKAVAPMTNPLIARSTAIRIYDDCMSVKGYQVVAN